jgi:hypothetical protein
MAELYKVKVLYPKRITYDNTDLYEDNFIEEGAKKLPDFIDWINMKFGTGKKQLSYTRESVYEMLVAHKLNKMHGGNKLIIKRVNIPGVYHGITVKVVGKVFNTKNW